MRSGNYQIEEPLVGRLRLTQIKKQLPLGAGMLKAAESGLVLEIYERLGQLRKAQDEKAKAEDKQDHLRVAELQAEIDELADECDRAIQGTGRRITLWR